MRNSRLDRRRLHEVWLGSVRNDGRLVFSLTPASDCDTIVSDKGQFSLVVLLILVLCFFFFSVNKTSCLLLFKRTLLFHLLSDKAPPARAAPAGSLPVNLMRCQCPAGPGRAGRLCHRLDRLSWIYPGKSFEFSNFRSLITLSFLTIFHPNLHHGISGNKNFPQVQKKSQKSKILILA